MLVSVRQVGVSGIIVGGFATVAAISMGALVTTNRLVVTSGGIIYWHNFRKKDIPWPSVRSFEIGTSRSMLRWSCLVVNSSSGRVRVDAVAGTRSFVEGVAEELRLFQQDHANL